MNRGVFMYSYIKGIITIIESIYVVLENNDIGYMIYVPNPYSYMYQSHGRHQL